MLYALRDITWNNNDVCFEVARILSSIFLRRDRNLEKNHARQNRHTVFKVPLNKYRYTRRDTLLTGLNLILNGVIAKKLESVSVPLKTMTVLVHVTICSLPENTERSQLNQIFNTHPSSFQLFTFHHLL